MNDICLSRHKGNSESLAANTRVAPAKALLRDQIYQWFLFRGSAGATCEEASRAMQIRYTTMSARISELRADGWLVQIVVNGEKMRRKTQGGSSAAVLRAQTAEERAGAFRSRQQAELFGGVA